jgi:hypothetical protein
MQLIEKSTEKVIDNYSKTFKDYDLKDGALLLLREPGKISLRQKLEEEKASSNGTKE